ncbi:Flp family type IVb pilin [Neobacillus sp. OS1-33]|uniref:Flp family type IVb pilin n=1 Tax=Neobacillus sp. OS1-33 TaxID=3070683 RepID=UPI0027E0D3EB|nr:Flp family type IVb pilin [Neobacillus sp. OS1-33]WML24991.1 Flp family type IVb pilin [Neobacillus sp. OS1-33]
MLKGIRNLVVQEEGQGLVEYGLIIGLVAVGCILALTTLKGSISTLLSGIKLKE